MPRYPQCVRSERTCASMLVIMTSDAVRVDFVVRLVRFMKLEEKYDKSALTLEETSAELGLTVPDVESLIDDGELLAKKIGEKSIVPMNSLEEYLGVEESAGQSYTTQPTNSDMGVSGLKTCSDGSILYVKARDEYRYSLYVTANGRKKRVIKGGFHSREEAEAALEKARNAINAAQIPFPAAGVMSTIPTVTTSVGRPRVTVQDYLDKNLFTMFSAPTPRTAHCYANAAKLLIKPIGKLYLDELTRANLQEALNGLSGMSQSSIDKARLVVKKLTEFAAETGEIPVDVGRKVKKVKSTQIDLRSDDEKVYSKEQIQVMLSCARQESSPMILAVLTILALTGMRPEEVRGLEKKDVHFDTQEISVRQAAIMKPILKEGHAFAKIDSPREAAIGPTKTPAGVRTLYVGEQGMAIVQEWLDYQKKNDPAKYESRFLFPSSTDAPLRDDVLNTRFYRLKRKYEDKLDIGWNLYRFRHTFATNLAEANVPIKTAMRLMGDSTTNVILGVYTHVRNDEARKAGEKINQVYTDMLAETNKPDSDG